MMELVTKKQQIIDNIIRLEKYLYHSTKSDIKQAKDLVKSGRTIIIYKVNGEDHFAPSRFVGYIDNDLKKHLEFEEKDGKDTNPVITKVLGNPFSNDKIENKFIDYCAKIGVEVPDNNRSYWRIRDNRGKYLDLNESI
ncbi:MAG: hypothetical protein JEZ09_05030 [Salinivirgaceae bacterium]|nr:hypothetical protein [Salinivirgaceae bacterium]